MLSPKESYFFDPILCQCSKLSLELIDIIIFLFLPIVIWPNKKVSAGVSLSLKFDTKNKPQELVDVKTKNSQEWPYEKNPHNISPCSLILAFDGPVYKLIIGFDFRKGKKNYILASDFSIWLQSDNK